MKKIQYLYIIENYFLLTALFGFLEMLSIHYFEYNYIIQLSLLFVGVSLIIGEKHNKIDEILILTIIIIVLSGYFLCPYNILYKVGVTGEIIPMFAYFIGKSEFCNNDKIFEKGVCVVAIVSIIGLWLYITQPAWYLNFRLSGFDIITDSVYLEMTRLSAFWEYPYWMSYGVAILYCFVLGRTLIENKLSKMIGYPLLFFFAIISLLTQQRASIGIIVLATIVYSIYYRKINNKSYAGIIKVSLIISFALLLLYLIISHFLDETRLDFIFSKFTEINERDNFIKDRANIFDNMHNVPISILGDGLGLYSHTAFGMGLKHYITDQGYMKMIYETGLIGFVLRIIIIAICLFKGLKDKRIYYFEITVIVMIMISLFGANSLSSMEMHNVIFWICCGRINNNQLLENKRQKLYN